MIDRNAIYSGMKFTHPTLGRLRVTGFWKRSPHMTIVSSDREGRTIYLDECPKAEAEYVAGYGVCGSLDPIEEFCEFATDEGDTGIREDRFA